ncbi:MAG: CBS domain-containing protein [Sphingomonadaceae bacterium]|nr:CBS domain-containing protein [Sphingomonadaceae bacterium]
MQIADIMTPAPETVAPQDTLKRAAELMDELNVGVLPVVGDGRLLGVITDRDITVRATAAGLAPDDAFVSEAMSANPRTVSPEDDVAEAQRIMSDQQVQRLPVVDSTGRLVGILSLGDLAESDPEGVEETLAEVSFPASPER